MIKWTTLGYLTERASALFIIMAVVTCREKKVDLSSKDSESFPGTLRTTLAEVGSFWLDYKAEGVHPDEGLFAVVHFPLAVTTRRLYFSWVGSLDDPAFPCGC